MALMIVPILPAPSSQPRAVSTQLSTNFSFPEGLQIYVLGSSSLRSVLTEAGIPASALNPVNSVAALQESQNRSVVAVDTTVYNMTVLGSAVGNLLSKGDLILAYVTTNSAPATAAAIGTAWASEFRSPVLALPALPLISGPSFVAVSGSMYVLSVSPVSTESAGAAIQDWLSVTTDPPNNGDPCSYTNQNPPTSGWTFLTQQVLGYQDGNWTFHYDTAIFVENKTVPGPNGVTGIPIIPMGYLAYIPTSTMISDNGYIASMLGTLDYANCDNAYLGTYSATANSYAYNIGVGGPGSTSSTASYTTTFAFPPSASFSVTYMPPSGSVSVTLSEPGLQGTPQIEDNDTWQFSYSMSQTSQTYSNGFIDNGQWQLSAGTNVYNRLVFPMEDQVYLVTKLTSTYWIKELITLDMYWSVVYNPSGSWYPGSSYTVLGLGYNGYPITSVTSQEIIVR